MIKFIDKILSFIFPKNTTCIICNSELDHNNENEICDTCEKILPFSSKKTCERCGVSIHSMARVCNRCQNRKKTFEFAMSPFDYDKQIVKLIHDLKYKNKKFIASTLSFYMAKCYCYHNKKCDLIIPVPIHTKRRKQRGYNQSELLCEHLIKHIDLPYEKDVLVRIKDTKTQVNLTYKERQENLQDAFIVKDKNKIKNKTILLVDDVFTTGATVINCTQALLKAGAEKVIVLCAAHTALEI